MNKIFGHRDNNGVQVTVDGKPVRLEPSLKLFNHSPSGFEIGYGGSGPAQLALAILLMFTDDRTAVQLHQDFKWRFLADPYLREGDIFHIIIDIPSWIKSQGVE